MCCDILLSGIIVEWCIFYSNNSDGVRFPFFIFNPRSVEKTELVKTAKKQQKNEILLRIANIPPFLGTIPTDGYPDLQGYSLFSIVIFQTGFPIFKIGNR